jgi:hypothetical protein
MGLSGRTRFGSKSDLDARNAMSALTPNELIEQLFPKGADIVAKVFLRGGAQILRPVGAAIE